MTVPSHVLSLVRAHHMLRPDRDARGRLQRGHGMRSRVPRQERPIHVESMYAAAIFRTLDVRDVLRPLIAELPELVRSAAAARADAADPEPTAIDVAGLRMVVENPAGSVRRWTDSDGTQGSTLMRWDYGYLDGFLGADGEDVDVYRGPNPDPQVVHVVHQASKASGFKEYDEDKVMLGWDSAADAAAAYLAQYDDPRFLRSMSSFPIDEFKALLRSSEGAPLAAAVTRSDAAEAGRVRAMIDRARKALDAKLNHRVLEDLARQYGQATSMFQRAQLARQVRAAIGIDLVNSDPNVPALMEHFVAENVALIKSLANRTLDDVEKTVTRAFTTGARAEDVADEIQQRYGVSERHARLIARDQIGKLNGQVNAARQKELGINKFTWRTVKDERVRDEHRALEGQVFSYDALPEEGLPGEPINCRCSAEPYFGDLLDELAGAGREASGPVVVGRTDAAEEVLGFAVWKGRLVPIRLLDRACQWPRPVLERRDEFNEDDHPRADDGKFTAGGGGGGHKGEAEGRGGGRAKGDDEDEDEGDDEGDENADGQAFINEARKEGETDEQYAKRMARNKASREAKKAARDAKKAADAKKGGGDQQPPKPDDAQPPGPDKAEPVAPRKEGESDEAYAKRLARNKASREAKKAVREAARKKAADAAKKPDEQKPEPVKEEPKPEEPKKDDAKDEPTAPRKDGESDADYAKRLARNKASREAKARARAAAKGQQPKPNAPPPGPKPLEKVESLGMELNLPPESTPALTKQSARELDKMFGRYADGGNSPKAPQQAAMRAHFRSLVAEYGMVDHDANMIGNGKHEMLMKPLLSRGYLGVHRWHGSIEVDSGSGRGAARFARAVANGEDIAAKIRAPGRQVIGSLGSRDNAQRRQADDDMFAHISDTHRERAVNSAIMHEAEKAANDARDYAVIVHETIHGTGPGVGNPGHYHGHGVLVEEVTTEVSARKIVRDKVGLKHGDVATLSRPESAFSPGAYSDMIHGATRAMSDALDQHGRENGWPMEARNKFIGDEGHVASYDVLERTSLRFRASHQRSYSPDEHSLLFSRSVDFEHIEKVTGRKMESDERAKLAAMVDKHITAAGVAAAKKKRP